MRICAIATGADIIIIILAGLLERSPGNPKPDPDPVTEVYNTYIEGIHLCCCRQCRHVQARFSIPRPFISPHCHEEIKYLVFDITEHVEAGILPGRTTTR
jgi:hypothetical protein